MSVAVRRQRHGPFALGLDLDDLDGRILPSGNQTTVLDGTGRGGGGTDRSSPDECKATSVGPTLIHDTHAATRPRIKAADERCNFLRGSIPVDMGGFAAESWGSGSEGMVLFAFDGVVFGESGQDVEHQSGAGLGETVMDFAGGIEGVDGQLGLG